MRFQGQVVLITGGARGIGRATGEIVAREGGTVVAVDTDAAALDEALAAFRATGASAHGATADALDTRQVTDTVDRVAARHGRIDVLVNAVGGSTIIGRPAATVDELSREEQQRLRRRQGRHHRLHPQAGPGAGTSRDQRQRHRPQPDPESAPSLGRHVPGGAGA